MQFCNRLKNALRISSCVVNSFRLSIHFTEEMVTLFNLAWSIFH